MENKRELTNEILGDLFSGSIGFDAGKQDLVAGIEKAAPTDSSSSASTGIDAPPNLNINVNVDQTVIQKGIEKTVKSVLRTTTDPEEIKKNYQDRSTVKNINSNIVGDVISNSPSISVSNRQTTQELINASGSGIIGIGNNIVSTNSDTTFQNKDNRVFSTPITANLNKTKSVFTSDPTKISFNTNNNESGVYTYFDDTANISNSQKDESELNGDISSKNTNSKYVLADRTSFARTLGINALNSTRENYDSRIRTISQNIILNTVPGASVNSQGILDNPIVEDFNRDQKLAIESQQLDIIESMYTPNSNGDIPGGATQEQQAKIINDMKSYFGFNDEKIKQIKAFKQTAINETITSGKKLLDPEEKNYNPAKAKELLQVAASAGNDEATLLIEKLNKDIIKLEKESEKELKPLPDPTRIYGGLSYDEFYDRKNTLEDLTQKGSSKAYVERMQADKTTMSSVNNMNFSLNGEYSKLALSTNTGENKNKILFDSKYTSRNNNQIPSIYLDERPRFYSQLREFNKTYKDSNTTETKNYIESLSDDFSQHPYAAFRVYDGQKFTGKYRIGNTIVDSMDEVSKRIDEELDFADRELKETGQLPSVSLNFGILDASLVQSSTAQNNIENNNTSTSVSVGSGQSNTSNLINQSVPNITGTDTTSGNIETLLTASTNLTPAVNNSTSISPLTNVNIQVAQNNVNNEINTTQSPVSSATSAYTPEELKSIANQNIKNTENSLLNIFNENIISESSPTASSNSYTTRNMEMTAARLDVINNENYSTIDKLGAAAVDILPGISGYTEKMFAENNTNKNYYENTLKETANTIIDQSKSKFLSTMESHAKYIQENKNLISDQQTKVTNKDQYGDQYGIIMEGINNIQFSSEDEKSNYIKKFNERYKYERKLEDLNKYRAIEANLNATTNIDDQTKEKIGSDLKQYFGFNDEKIEELKKFEIEHIKRINEENKLKAQNAQSNNDISNIESKALQELTETTPFIVNESPITSIALDTQPKTEETSTTISNNETLINAENSNSVSSVDVSPQQSQQQTIPTAVNLEIRASTPISQNAETIANPSSYVTSPFISNSEKTVTNNSVNFVDAAALYSQLSAFNTNNVSDFNNNSLVAINQSNNSFTNNNQSTQPNNSFTNNNQSTQSNNSFTNNNQSNQSNNIVTHNNQSNNIVTHNNQSNNIVTNNNQSNQSNNIVTNNNQSNNSFTNNNQSNNSFTNNNQSNNSFTNNSQSNQSNNIIANNSQLNNTTTQTKIEDIFQTYQVATKESPSNNETLVDMLIAPYSQTDSILSIYNDQNSMSGGTEIENINLSSNLNISNQNQQNTEPDISEVNQTTVTNMDNRQTENNKSISNIFSGNNINFISNAYRSYQTMISNVSKTNTQDPFENIKTVIKQVIEEERISKEIKERQLEEEIYQSNELSFESPDNAGIDDFISQQPADTTNINENIMNDYSALLEITEKTNNPPYWRIVVG